MKTHQATTNDRLLKFLNAPPDVRRRIDSILDGKTQHQPATNSGPLLLSMSGAARYLGISRATLWRAIRSRKLQKVELFPGSYRLRRTDVEALTFPRRHKEAS